MRRLAPIAKFLAALFTAIVIAAQAPITDGTITTGEWVAIVAAVLGSGVVWKVENKPTDDGTTLRRL
jgi:hypothetical protein